MIHSYLNMQFQEDNNKPSEPKFDFYWNNYNSAIKWYRSNYKNQSHKVPSWNNFNEYTKSVQQASVAAHYCALNALKHQFPTKPKTKVEKILKNSNKTSNPPKEQEKSAVEFEISDNFVEFYKQSLIYKQEKKNEEIKRLKDIAEGKSMDYVAGEQVKSYQKLATINPPLEIAGGKREEELEKLYGKHAKSIHIAETTMQMEFDKNLDIYSPVYWPSLPLKL